ncbi:MAG: PilZ domain-containing protein [Candidatus Sulfotelmatobacter sp.]
MECLILTADPTLLGDMRATLGERGVSMQFRQDPESAIELSSRRHLDGLVVDCDVRESAKALDQLRNSPANKQTLILAVVNRSMGEREAIELGADFALNKPVQQTRLHNILELAIPKMEREHRRYFRYKFDWPIRFRDPLEQSFIAGAIQNISEGGLAIKLINPIKLKGVVIVEFDLPSVEPRLFHGKAEIVWSDSFTMGLRFLYIEKNSADYFRSWLNSLEASARFHESSAQRKF